jgi:deoxyguanosine kinase
MSRYRQHEGLRDDGTVLVSDYIFAKNDLFARFTLNGEEHTLYQQISEALAAHLATPSLVVLLKADLDVLMERIQKRGRDYEQGESMRDYMENLTHQYDVFFKDYTDAPVLVLNTNTVNIVEDAAARQDVVKRVLREFKQVLADRPTQVPLL